MAPTGSTRRKRQRGEIEPLPSGSLRVRVYAGIDPISRKRHYLTEVIPPGKEAAREAEKARTRFLAEVDDRRNARTKATVEQLMERYLGVLQIEDTTRAGYERLTRRHIGPLLGHLPIGRIDGETLDSFYRELRRCRSHCAGRPFDEHHTAGEHTCDKRCHKHACKPLSTSSVRQTHNLLNGAFTRAVRWRWVGSNPVRQAEPPALPKADPQPPTPAQAAAIATTAWATPDWGMLAWLAMTTGARRGELCALNRSAGPARIGCCRSGHAPTTSAAMPHSLVNDASPGHDASGADPAVSGAARDGSGPRFARGVGMWSVQQRQITRGEVPADGPTYEELVAVVAEQAGRIEQLLAEVEQLRADNVELPADSRVQRNRRRQAGRRIRVQCRRLHDRHRQCHQHRHHDDDSR